MALFHPVLYYEIPCSYISFTTNVTIFFILESSIAMSVSFLTYLSLTDVRASSCAIEAIPFFFI